MGFPEISSVIYIDSDRLVEIKMNEVLVHLSAHIDSNGTGELSDDDEMTMPSRHSPVGYTTSGVHH